MRFELAKVGGVAGLRRQAIAVDSDRLSARERTGLHELAEAARVFELPPELGDRGTAPDELGYVLVVTDGNRRAEVGFAYRDADDRLRSLLHELQRLGGAGTGGRPQGGSGAP